MMHKIKIIFSWLLIGILFLGALEPGSDAFAAKKNKYIRMNVKSITLSKNGMYKLRLYNTKKRQTIVFSSDNEAVATVVSTTQPKLAVVTAVNPGNTYVRATISNSRGRVVRTLKVKVKVTPYAVSVKFGKKKIYLNETKNTKLNTIIKPNISQEIPLYESSDTDVATVNSRGIVTAVAAGEAVITATLLSSGQSASCTVVVKPEPVETAPPDATSTTSAAKNIRSN
ncbi:MAG: Ig-like domain-containing protein [Eubacterium sp.]|nr:Ig-like domain-containing protein [Eubacterium sp.]